MVAARKSTAPAVAFCNASTGALWQTAPVAASGRGTESVEGMQTRAIFRGILLGGRLAQPVRSANSTGTLAGRIRPKPATVTQLIITMTKENLIRGLNEDLAADLKGMLELNVKMESEDVANYLAHAKLAEELALPELKMKLEEMAANEAGHGRELRRLLKGL
jgi:hypothetical protein